VPSTDPQDPSLLQPVQRTACYAVVRNAAAEVVLVRASGRSELAGRWFLPGGGLRHGEHPRDCALRGLAQQTGLRAVVATPRDAGSDVLDLPLGGVRLHTLRLIYDVELPADQRGTTSLASSTAKDSSTDAARFFSLAEAGELPLMPFVAEALGLPVPSLPVPVVPEHPEPLVLGGAPDRDPDAVTDLVADPGTEPGDTGGELPVRVQRPAAYAVLVDQTGRDGSGPRMLLTRLAGSKGTWTLPGGGIDHGEHPLVALRRELYEETGLPYLPGPLIDIGSRVFVGRSMDGRLEDFQGLRLVYGGSVPLDQTPRVVEVDGSTDKVAWLPVSELGRTVVVSAVRESYAIWQQQQRQQQRRQAR
jgi:8-oxo-dGTP diphosphatase